jgi:Hypothetical glycosyl hydrolase family 15
MKLRNTLLLVLLVPIIVIIIGASVFVVIRGSHEKREAVKTIPTLDPLSKLADTRENIHLFLSFNNARLQNPHMLVGKIQYLWGPNQNKPITASIYTSAYVPSDWPALLHNSFNWWKANHPDWIVYKCDRTTPAFIDPTQPSAVPLDISNPAVRNYQMHTYIHPFLRNGNNSIGFDNVILENYTGKCGVWRNGKWMQLYSGEYNDPIYANVVVAWAKAMYEYIHHCAASVGVAFNMNITTSPTSYRLLAPYADIIFDEGGFTNFGKPGNNYITDSLWLRQIRTIQHIIQLGKGFILNAYEPEASYRDITRQEILWDLSNYLLIKGLHTFTYVSVNQDSPEKGIFFDQQDYHVPIGQPASDMFPSQGVYMRTYSNGLVIVNPSSTNSYHLHFNNPYDDMQGNTFTSYTIGVHSGLILLHESRNYSVQLGGK